MNQTELINPVSKTELLKCPRCKKNSIKYIDTGHWFCEFCHRPFRGLGLVGGLSDTEKYQLYRTYGAQALSELTGESIEDIQDFVAYYFEQLCMERKSACVYYNELKREVEATEKIEEEFLKAHQEKLEKHNERIKNRPEKMNEAARRYREKHPERVRESTRRYRENHPISVLEAARRYREKHPERAREAARRFYEKHPEKAREAVRRYYQKNRDKILAKSRERYRKRKNERNHSSKNQEGKRL